MISIGHWGCFFMEYPTGYYRFGKAAADWYFTVYVEF